jgi:hypothetical protein
MTAGRARSDAITATPSSSCPAPTAPPPTRRPGFRPPIAASRLEHLQAYLDEFVFRHNRRPTPMAALQTLLEIGALHQPTTYRQITRRATTALAEQTG